MKISRLSGLQIFDSQGNPTIEASIELENGIRGTGPVPSSASTGRHKAVERRDGNPTRYQGKSVFGAIDSVNREIARAVVGRDIFDQEGLDQTLIALDGTVNKSRLGANAILAVSMAAARAGAAARGLELYEYLGQGSGELLPPPEILVIGGGRHARGRIDLQDCMVIALEAKTYDEAIEVSPMFSMPLRAARKCC